MCGSGRLETSCHSGAMMAGLRKRGRGRFAEKTAKLQVRRISLSLRGAFAPACPHDLNRLVPRVALGRQRHYTRTTAHLELAMREALALVQMTAPHAASKW